MKKLLAIVLVLTMILSVTGCSQGVTAKFVEDLNYDEATGQYINEKDAKLVLWTDNEDYGNKVIELWNEKYPEVELTFEDINATDVAEKIKLDGPAGLGGDVFYMPHNSIVDLREAGALFTLPELDKNQLMDYMQESAYKVAMYEGDMYAVPSSVENIALVYNKQILEVLPVIDSELLGNSTNLLEQIENEEIYLEELLAGVAAWGNNYAGTGVDIPYMEDRFYVSEEEGVSSSEDIHTIMAWQLYDAYHNYPFLTGAGYRVFGEDNNDPTMFNMTSSEVTESIKAFSGDWYGNKSESKLFPGLASIEDMGWDQGPSRFQKGQVAMTISGPWVLGDLKANWEEWIAEGKFGITEDTQLADIIGAKSLPSFKNGEVPVTFSGVQVTGMNIYTNYPNAAMNLLNFLASEEVMREVYEVLGKIPAVKDSNLIPDLNEDTISQGFLSQAANSHPMPVIQEGNYMWDPLRDVWTNIFVEEMTVEDAQARAQEDYERILKDSGN